MGSHLGTHFPAEQTRRENFRIWACRFLMAPWEALLRECCESVINTMENGARRIPPIPLETLVVLVWLFKLLGRRFGATVMSPHGARTGGAKRQSAGCVRFCSRNPKRRLGGAKTVKYKRAADSASGTNAGRAGGGMVPEPWRILGRRFGATVMSPHGARTGAAECQAGAKRRPEKAVHFHTFSPKVENRFRA